MNQPDTLSKKVFFVCLFFFVLLYAYAIYYAELRMQYEGAEDTILTCLGEFRIPFYRYAYILNKVLFVLALQLHLSFKVATALYSLNDGLFYLFIALCIIRFTCRYDYAATVLAAPLLLHETVFYYIANEIFLSGSMMLLFTAVHLYMKEGLLKKVLLLLSMFFVIWSNPAILILLGLFIPFIWHSVEQAKKEWKLLLFMAVNVISRLLLFTNYDHTQLGHFQGAWFNLDFLLHTADTYFNDYQYSFVTGICTALAIYHSNHRIRYAGLIMLPVSLACCSAFNTHIGEPYFSKFIYPVALFMLLQAFVYVHHLPDKLRFLPAVLVGLVLFYGGKSLVDHNHNTMYNRTVITHRLNTLCATEDSSQSKWYVRQKSLNMPFLFGSDDCHESLFYSEYENRSPSVQLAHVKEEEVAKLDSVPGDMLLAKMNWTYPIKQLDPYYFQVQPGKYKELKIDSAQRKFLLQDLNYDNL